MEVKNYIIQDQSKNGDYVKVGFKIRSTSKVRVEVKVVTKV